MGVVVMFVLEQIRHIVQHTAFWDALDLRLAWISCCLMVLIYSYVGIECLLGRQLGGVGSPARAYCSYSILSHLMWAMMIEGGRLVSEIMGWPTGSCQHDKASDLFWYLGFSAWLITVKLNHVKHKAHQAWHGFKCLALHKFSRVLWSVITWNGWGAPSNQCHHSSKASLMKLL